MLLVISDLHLGGDDGFEICSRQGRQRLAEFIRWAGELRGAAQDVHLVINGDIVDFLAEKDAQGTFAAFTADERVAAEKLERIFGRTAPVWDALEGFVRRGGELTLLIGNHDVELCLPRLRRRLRDRLGPGRVELVYDNQALGRGPVIIEHGNRYDSWNAIAHDSLRQFRSRLTRGNTSEEFAPPPGSELVVQVMNELKARYSFVDLLKPETGAVLPILAALGAGTWRVARDGVFLAAQRAWRTRKFDADHQPADNDLIAGRPGGQGDAGEAFPEAAAFEAADAIAGSTDDGLISSRRDPPPRASVLQAALRKFAQDGSIFDVGREDRTYAVPAQRLLAGGAAVVVFGHTHLAKDITFEAGGRYLNSGTWADLMRIPLAVLRGPAGAAEAALASFLDDVRANRLDRTRRLVATFVQLELGPADELLGGGTFFFDEGGKTEPLSSAGLLARLEADASV
jgi:UDP-2,3-diacylglucosamine pyrophosphatase LpxH